MDPSCILNHGLVCLVSSGVDIQSLCDWKKKQKQNRWPIPKDHQRSRLRPLEGAGKILQHPAGASCQFSRENMVTSDSSLGKSQKSGFEWILQMFDGEKKNHKKTPTSPRISREAIKKRPMS